MKIRKTRLLCLYVMVIFFVGSGQIFAQEPNFVPPYIIDTPSDPSETLSEESLVLLGELIQQSQQDNSPTGINYDRNAALYWARPRTQTEISQGIIFSSPLDGRNNNDNVPRGVDGNGNVRDQRHCTTYVGGALNAGGISVPSLYGVSYLVGNHELVDWMYRNPGYWEFRNSINDLEAGDFILYSTDSNAIANWNSYGPGNYNYQWGHTALALGNGLMGEWNPENYNSANRGYVSTLYVHIVSASNQTAPIGEPLTTDPGFSAGTQYWHPDTGTTTTIATIDSNANLIFWRESTNPSGLYQNLPYSVPSYSVLELEVDLMNFNFSGNDQRVRVHLQNGDTWTSGDVYVCNWVVEPFDSIRRYTMRVTLPHEWSNLRVLVHGNTLNSSGNVITGEQGIVVDNLGVRRVNGVGVTPGQECYAPATTTTWNFASGPLGWTIDHSIEAIGPGIDGGTIWAINGNDPYMHSPGLRNIDADNYPGIVIEMASTVTPSSAAECVQVFFKGLTTNYFTGSESVNFTDVVADGEDYTYYIPMSSNPNWTGDIGMLRFDPAGGCSSSTYLTGDVRINRIQLSPYYELNNPYSLGATANGSGGVDLSWVHSDSTESGFRIERTPYSSTNWQLIHTNSANDYTYTDTSVTCGQAYRYRVYTYRNGDGTESDNSNTVTVTPTCTVSSSIVINEIDTSNPDMIELYNKSSSSVDISGWQIYVDGSLFYTMPSSTTIGGYASLIIVEGSGIDSSRVKYAGNGISWGTTGGGGAVGLTNGSTGIDFMRYGTSTVTPPSGTSWSGTVSAPTLTNTSIARNSSSSDGNTASDWSLQTPTFGSSNLGYRVSSASTTLLINEVDLYNPDGIELYNYGSSSVTTTGFSLWAYYEDQPQIVYVFPNSFVIPPYSYVVLRETSGTNTYSTLYMNQGISWDVNSNGAVALKFGNQAMDFVTFGSGSTISTPQGTSWTTSPANSVANIANNTLSRSETSYDSNTATDWTEKTRTLGTANLTIINIADGDTAALATALQNAADTGTDTVINLATNGHYNIDHQYNLYDPETGFAATYTNITINGNGATIQRVDIGNDFRFFYQSGGRFTLRDLTLTNGLSDYGGAIESFGELILENVVIQNSTATASGGAIYTGGLMTMTNGSILNNWARWGGGIYASMATVTMDGVAIIGNTAESVDNSGGSGGGIDLSTDSVLTATNLTVEQNTAIWGGSLLLYDATADIIGGTWHNNTASYGGAFYTNEYPTADTITNRFGGQISRVETHDGQLIQSNLSDTVPPPDDAELDFDNRQRPNNDATINAGTGSELNIYDAIVSSNTEYSGTAIYTYLGQVTINNTCITGNDHIAISNQDDRYFIDASNNWWGDVGGPGGSGGSLWGDQISARVAYGSYQTTRPVNCDTNSQSTHWIRGRVTDELTYGSIANVLVSAQDNNDYNNWHTWTCTDTSGYYMLRDVPADTPIRLWAGDTYNNICNTTQIYAREYYDNTNDYASATLVTLTSGSPTLANANFTLLPTGELVVNVFDETYANPTPVSRIAAYFQYGQTLHGECVTNGSTTFAAPLTVPVYVSVRTASWCSTDSYEWRAPDAPVTLTVQQPTQTVTINTRPAGTIAGTIYDTSVQPLPYIYVTESTTIYEYAYSASDGTYTIYGIPFNTPATLRAGGSGTGYGYEWWSNQPTQELAQSISVSESQPNVTGFNFTLAEASTISGQVTYENGLPAINIPIEVDGWGSGYWGCTDSNGMYTLYSVAVGNSYKVVAGGHHDYCSGRYTENTWYGDVQSNGLASSIYIPSTSGVSNINIAIPFPFDVVDINSDGVVSPTDVIYVINRLGTGDLSADIDGNGIIDTTDVQTIQTMLGNSSP